MENYGLVEEEISKLVVNVTLKLNEEELKPFFLRMIDWQATSTTITTSASDSMEMDTEGGGASSNSGSSGSGSSRRKTIFYRVVNHLADTLKVGGGELI